MHIEKTSTQSEIYTTIEDIEDYWGHPHDDWGILGHTDVSGDEIVRFVRARQESEWQLERKDGGIWFVALNERFELHDIPE